MIKDLSWPVPAIKLSCCRWGGATPKAAELKAKPSVATADKAVNDAMESQQQTPGASSHSTNRTAEAAATSEQLSNKGVDGLHPLQRRPKGQNQQSSLCS